VSERFVERARVRIAYQLVGEGPPIVLLQGLGMPGRMWLGLIGGLARNGRTVIVPDNRGTGRSDAPLPPYRMATLADDVAAVLAAERAARAIVVGISFGGMIAQELALRRPARVAGLVLAATTCGAPFGRPPPLAFLWELARASLGDRRALAALRTRLVHRRTLERNPQLFAAWDREVMVEPTRLRGMLGQLSAATMHSTGWRLRRLALPVEIVTGDDDRIVPPENSRVLEQLLPDARLTVVRDAGHAFPLDDPAALPQAISRLESRLAR
jgi:pimeloyl-ACP methyl ester carboxylesterase